MSVFDFAEFGKNAIPKSVFTNGAENEKVHLQKPITEEQALNEPLIAEPLGLFDCCGVSDGAAAAIVTTPEIAKSLGKDNIVSVKALQLSEAGGAINDVMDGFYDADGQIPCQIDGGLYYWGVRPGPRRRTRPVQTWVLE